MDDVVFPVEVCVEQLERELVDWRSRCQKNPQRTRLLKDRVREYKEED